jgi:hypothetical protein
MNFNVRSGPARIFVDLRHLATSSFAAGKGSPVDGGRMIGVGRPKSSR